MFNIGPSTGMMRKFLPQQPGGDMGGMPMPMPGGMGGDMPIDKFPGMPMPPQGSPRMPQIIDSAPSGGFFGRMMGGIQDMLPQIMAARQGGMGGGMPRRPMPESGGSARPQPMPGRMSPDRPGFWGKYNTIAQGLQGPAMEMLMGGNRRPQY